MYGEIIEKMHQRLTLLEVNQQSLLAIVEHLQERVLNDYVRGASGGIHNANSRPGHNADAKRVETPSDCDGGSDQSGASEKGRS